MLHYEWQGVSKISLRKSKGLGYCFTELWQTIAVSRVTLLQPFNSKMPNPALDKLFLVSYCNKEAPFKV